MALLDDYKDKCATCEYYDLGVKDYMNHVGFWCNNWRRGCCTPLDDTCPSYSKAKGRSEKYLESSIRMFNRGYYILTAVSRILGLPENNKYIQIFMEIENKYSDVPAFQTLLNKYDEVGPEIADVLLVDSNRLNIAKKLMTDYIIPAFEFYNDGKIGEAISTYIKMVMDLKNICVVNKENTKNIETDIHKTRRRKK